MCPSRQTLGRSKSRRCEALFFVPPLCRAVRLRGRRTTEVLAAVHRQRSRGLSVARAASAPPVELGNSGTLACHSSAASPLRNPPGKWARRFYVPGSSMKRSPNPIRSLAKARLASRAGQDAFAPTQKSRFASAAHFVRMPMSVPRPQRPNPSVEGTHNGGTLLFASSSLAAPSCAPHVKR